MEVDDAFKFNFHGGREGAVPAALHGLLTRLTVLGVASSKGEAKKKRKV